MKQSNNCEVRNTKIGPCGCNPRAAPPGEYGLKSGENGHLARANGAIDGPYCSPTWPSVFGRRCGVSRWLVGAVGLGGGAAHQRPHAARGALLQFEWLSKTRGAQAFRAWRGRLCAGWLSCYARPLFPGGPGGTKPLLFTTHGPPQMCKKKPLVVHVARW
jgi:hypothetical protein